MRISTFLSVALLLSAINTKAQTLSTFETLPFKSSDTFYKNTTGPASVDNGFDDGLGHFPYYWDTSFGGFWSSGFAYSNKKDSVNGTYTNLYSAITAKGYNNSAAYIAVNQNGDVPNIINLKGAAIGNPVYGFYVTNSTYAYKIMRNGDQFGFAKKFGGPTGNDPDWFKLTIRGYLNDTLKPDSVEVYLADFRDPDNTKDSILRNWKWVDLLPLGNVDSLQLLVNSSDRGQFGMNTPAFYSIDNLKTFETADVKNISAHYAAKVYPNPAKNELFIQLTDNSFDRLYILDVTGRVVMEQEIKDKLTSVHIEHLKASIYILQLAGKDENATVRFVKQ
jgi:hypothetical protein